MGGPMFDTLSYSKRLREAGVPEAQAEAHATLLIEAVQENLATKQDVAELKRDLVTLENRMTIKLGLMLAASIAIVAAVVRLP